MVPNTGGAAQCCTLCFACFFVTFLSASEWNDGKRESIADSPLKTAAYRLVNSLSSACLVSNYLDVYFLLLFFPQAMGWRDLDEVRMMIKLEDRSDTIDGLSLHWR